MKKLRHLIKCCDKSQIILILFLVASIMFIAKKTNLQAPKILPQHIQILLAAPESSDPYYSLYDLLYNLGLAYISSIIFYVVVEYIPNKQKARKALKLLSGNLILLYQNMGMFIGEFLFVSRKNDDHMNFLFNSYDLKYYQIVNGTESAPITGKYNFDALVDTARSIINSINNMYKYPIIGNLDSNLIDCLTEICSCEFLEQLINIKDEKIKSVGITMEELGKLAPMQYPEILANFSRFRNCYDILKRYPFKKVEYRFVY